MGRKNQIGGLHIGVLSIVAATIGEGCFIENVLMNEFQSGSGCYR